MAISRMQEPRQLYGLGSLVKGVKKAVKGVAKGIKDVAKSPIGKAAMLYFGGNLLQGNAMFGNPFTGRITDFIASKGIPSILSKSKGEGAALKNFGKIFAGGSALTALLGAAQEGDEEAVAATQNVDSLKKYLRSYYTNLGYEDDQIDDFVIRDTSEYTQDMARGQMAMGGRIGYAFGDKVEMAAGIEGLPININPKGVKELDLRETGGFIAPVGVKEKADDIPAMLSNNEFVFTADAVRAAGGGSVDKGAQIMYDTMKKLESKVV